MKAKVGLKTLKASPKMHREPLGVLTENLLAGRLTGSRNLRTCASSHSCSPGPAEQRLQWLYIAKNIDSITCQEVKKQTATTVTYNPKAATTTNPG